MVARRLHKRTLRAFQEAGGKCREFLPLNPLMRRIQINMRNHRKILVVDGRVAFTGGFNIGDEYLRNNPRYRSWRGTYFAFQVPDAVEMLIHSISLYSIHHPSSSTNPSTFSHTPH